MWLKVELPKLQLYFTLDEEFCTFLEEQGINHAAADNLARLQLNYYESLKSQ